MSQKIGNMKELRDRLWDLVYGLLDEAESARLRAQITSDRQVAREYARVKLQSELLAQAARAKQTERELPALPERPRLAVADRGMSSIRLAALACSLALSVGLLLFAGSVYWSNETTLRGPAVAQALEGFQDRYPRLMVVGPAELVRGATNTYEVNVQTLDGEPLEAPIKASLEDRNGTEVWYQPAFTDSTGKRQLQLPKDLSGGAYRFHVEVEGDSDREKLDPAEGAEFSTWLSVNEQPQRELLVVNRVSDGEQAFFREAELGTRYRRELSEELDGITDRPNSDRKKSLNKARGEADVALAEEAQGVRWGQERFADLPARAKDSRTPSISQSERQLDANEDFVKQMQDEAGVAKGYKNARNPATAAGGGAPPGTAAGEKKEMPAPPWPAEAQKQSESLPELNRPKSSQEVEESKLLKQKGAQEGGGAPYLESISANGRLVASRMVDYSIVADKLPARIDELRQEGLLDHNFSGRVDAVLYDPAVAPPQKVAEASVEIPPTVEPLNCRIRFDRNYYRAGDIAEVELQVSDLQGLPLPAILNVQVDAIPLFQSDSVDEPSPPQIMFTSIESPQVPLVFDNAAEQSKRLNESLSLWVSERQEAQRHSGWLLLAGGAVGLCLLLVAGLLKWLPKPTYWLPVAGLLLGSMALATVWLRAAQPPVSHIAPDTPLTTYGVQTELPAMSLEEDRSRESNLGHKLALEKLATEDSAERSSTFEDFAWPEIAAAPSDGAKGTSDAQTLLAMADWERLAESTNGAAKGNSLARSDDFSGDAERRAEKSPVTELADKHETPLGQDADFGLPRMILRQTFVPNDTTIYWHPRITTDASGVCRVRFELPENPQALRLSAISHSGKRLGSTTTLIPTVVEYRPQ